MSEKINCRICARVERRLDFVDIFESRFKPDKSSEEIFLYEAMQQLTGAEVCLPFVCGFWMFFILSFKRLKFTSFVFFALL